MSFAAPEYLWVVMAIVLVAVVILRGETGRRQALEALAEPHLADRIIRSASFRKRITAHVCFLFALSLMAVALMRPQWGLVREQLSVSGIDVVIALDISRSMLSDDTRPSRLEAAKNSIRRLLDTRSGDRIGLVAFAGTAFTVCPLTADHDIVRQTLQEIEPEELPQGGSSISSALNEALRAFRATPEGGRVLILVSDGEDHDGGIIPALEKLRNAGITVVAAVAGSEQGALMPLPAGGFVKDRRGAVVKSRASYATIRGIDPAAIPLQENGNSLLTLLNRARTGATESVRTASRHRLAERFQIPLAGAVFLLICSMFVSGRTRP